MVTREQTDPASAAASRTGGAGARRKGAVRGGASAEAERKPVPPAAMLSSLRRATGKASLLAFMRAYLPHYFKLEPSPMHEALATELERMAGDRGSRMAVAAPRGHAKSTLVTLGYVLWCVVYRRESFIVIASDTADQAQDHLAHIKAELEGNERLIEDFPEACELPPGSGTRPPATRWRRDDIATRHGVRVYAVGSGQRLRGKRHQHARPTLIILDDVENEESVRSQEQRQQKTEWFTSTVTKAGTAWTNIVLVGTVLHSDSLLANALDPCRMPGWRGMRFRAVIRWPERMDLWDRWEGVYNLREEFGGHAGPDASRRFFEANAQEMERGAELLWPRADSLLDLMTLRTRDGAPSFEREKQNEPASMEHTVFNPAQVYYWDDVGGGVPSPLETTPVPGVPGHGRGFGDPPPVVRAATPFELLAALGSGTKVIIGVDPSLGLPGGRHDNSAVVVLAKRWREAICYVLDADISRRRPEELVAHIVRVAQQYGSREIGVESVQFQSLLASSLKLSLANAGMGGVRVREVKQTTSKIARIQGMQPAIASGRVMFSRRQVSLVNELLTFPYGSHDDGPDALEIALRCADQPDSYATRAIGGVSP